jgi:hypothetical protein
MDWWIKIRLNVLRGEKNKREVLREEGVHWETLKKILKYSEPPGYRLKEPRLKPKIDPYLPSRQKILCVRASKTPCDCAHFCAHGKKIDANSCQSMPTWVIFQLIGRLCNY